MQPGEAYHLAITFGPAGFELYLNGELADSNDEFTQGIETNLEELAIGANIWGRSDDHPRFARDEFTGTISDFAIYRRQLNQNQISDLSGWSPGLAMTDSKAIEDVLLDALDADVRDQELESGQHHVDAIFGDDSDDLLVAQSRVLSENVLFAVTSEVSDPNRLAPLHNGLPGRYEWIGSERGHPRISRVDGPPTTEYRSA